MKLELLTLDGAKFDGEVREVSLKTSSGQIAIRPGHEAMTSIISAGPVAITALDGEITYYAAFGGLLEVYPDRVRMLADDAEPADGLIEAEIEEALALARKLRDDATSMHEVRRATEMADRHNVRLEVSRMHRRRRQR